MKNWYEHAPEGVVENEEVKISTQQRDHSKEPDIVVVHKNETGCAIIDIAVPGDMSY